MSKKNEEVRTEQQLAQLPKINEDLSWDWAVGNRKYRLREATLEQLRLSNMGQDQTALLPLVTEETLGDGKSRPFEWPKGGVHRLFQSLGMAYMMGLAALEAELKKCGSILIGTSSEATSSTAGPELLVRP